MWKTEKTGKDTQDLIWSGVETGIAPSPLKGTANLQNVNINTELGEVMCNFSRIQQTVTTFSGGTTARAGGGTSVILIGDSNHFFLPGDAITLTNSTMSNLPNGNYYIQANVSGSIGNQEVGLTATYRGGVISSIGTGTANFGTYDLLPAIASATEKYYDGTQIQYRYYVLGSNSSSGNVWVLDTGSNSPNIWTPLKLQGNFNFSNATGLAFLNGYLFMFQFNSDIWVVETELLGNDWQVLGVTFNSPSFSQLLPRYCLVSHTGTLNVTDGNFIATISPNSSSGAGVANNYSYGIYTFSTYTLTLTNQLSGDFPIIGQTITFTNSNGTLPTGLSVNTVYYVTNGTNSVYTPTSGTFSVSATVGGSAISLSGTPGGTQYFNSFNPLVGTTFTFDGQACTINDGTPSETALSMAELGNSIIIGTTGNTLYQWDGISPTWTNFIPLAESNAAFLLTVNNIVLIFAGTKGNIYVTSGSAASGALTVPDYVAGVPGSPSTYIEPYFTWGQAIFLRGRVFFSVQDQTASKAGNAGGIYSFVPSFYNAITGSDAGISLRMENQNSYGTSNGLATVLFAPQNQIAIGPQYWSVWTSSLSSPTYGIDFSNTIPTATAIVETDILNSGTMLNKKTFAQQEYKLSTPLLSGESVQLYYRLNLTDAWNSCGTVVAEANSLSGYFTSDFQITQWLQLRAFLIPNGTSTFSGNRLTELRLR